VWVFSLFVVSCWSQTHLHVPHPFSMSLHVPVYRDLPTYLGAKLKNSKE